MSALISDQAAREAALNIKQSFIVQAPAGSGKTELLTQRILKLLAHAEEPEEILAITFTRKAASEMRTRILKSLNYARLLQEKYTHTDLLDFLENSEPHEKTSIELSLAALDQDKKLSWNLIDNPNRLQLKTIDSFCSSIVFQLPILAELGGQTNVSENADMLYRHASKAFIASLEKEQAWSPSLARVLIYLDKRSEQLEDIFVSMLHRRPQWISLVLRFSASIKDQAHLALKEHMEFAIRDIVERHLGLLKNADGFYLLNELDEIIPFCSANAPDHTSTALLQGLSKVKTLGIDDIAHWKNIVSLLLTNEGAWRSPKGVNRNLGFPAEKSGEAKEKKIQFQSLLSELTAHPKLEAHLQNLKNLPEITISEQQLAISADICECLIILLAYLKLSFQEYNRVDFNEIQLRASKALSPDIDDPQQNDKAALLALDAKIKHILIDEYQDTSNSQLELLENLISQWQYQDDGKSLFLVGDPMQSIYRFREANVGIFIQAQEYGVQNIKLNKLSLSSNFRSSPNIVNWVNTSFSDCFPSTNDYQIGAIAYSPSIAFKKNEENSPAVEYHLTEIEWGSEYQARTQAEQICEKIQHIKNNDNTKSIAILVRSKNHARTIISLLKEKEISYQGIDMDSLADCPHIINLINLSAALLHQGDQLAWYGLLRSSLCGIENADLLKLSTLTHSNEMPLGLYLNEHNDYSELSSEAQNILHRSVPIISASIQDLELKPFSFVVESCWLTLGGPASLYENQALDCEKFFSLLRELEKQSEIIDANVLREACDKLFADSKSSDDYPVLIMSIHKSKGLEFDHVFLPSLEKGTRSDTKSLLNWDVYKNEQAQQYLLLAPLLPSHILNDDILLYDYLEQQEKEKSNNENIRLFYVACTRAKSNLYLYGSVKQKLDKKSGELSLAEPSSNSLLSLVWKNIENNKENSSFSIFYYSSKNTKQVNNKENTYTLRRLAHNWKNIPSFQMKNYALENNTPNHNISHENRIENIMANKNSASVLGTLVHSCLKQFTECDRLKKKTNWLSLSDYSLYHSSWKKLIRNEGIYASDIIEHLINTCESILKTTLSDQKHEWLFQHELEQSQCEQSIFYIEKNTGNIDDFKQFIVDRSFIYEGVRWIIDYKTTEPKTQQNLTSFFEEQEKEYRQQLTNYALCYQQLESLPQQLALYFPKLAQLHCLK